MIVWLYVVGILDPFIYNRPCLAKILFYTTTLQLGGEGVVAKIIVGWLLCCGKGIVSVFLTFCTLSFKVIGTYPQNQKTAEIRHKKFLPYFRLTIIVNQKINSSYTTYKFLKIDTLFQTKPVSILYPIYLYINFGILCTKDYGVML